MKRFIPRPITAIAVLVFACVSVVAISMSIAGLNVSKGSGNAVGKVIARGGDDTTSVINTTFERLPGSLVRVSVPNGRTALLTARFSAQSVCTEGTGTQYCQVRVLFDGQPGSPSSTEGDIFDSTDGGTESFGSYESHAIDRFQTVDEGIHTVEVQTSVSSAKTQLLLTNWALIVERSLK